VRVAGTERTNLDSPHGLRSVNCRRTGLGRRGDEDGRGFVRTTVGAHQAVVARSPRAPVAQAGIGCRRQGASANGTGVVVGCTLGSGSV